MKCSNSSPTAAASDEPFSPCGQFLCDEASYLKAIAVTPNDRLLRRLYADWLEALEPRRSELICVCEAMRDVPVWSDRYWELKVRRNELWEHCPLEWLEATGYDGSYYDPMFRDGVPDGVRERWRLIREFTERWHGIPVPDVGGRQAEIAEAETRLGLELPPSLREFVSYVHDLGACSPAIDPRCYNTLFHSAYYLFHHLHHHSALSLIHFTLDSSVLGVAHADLDVADPRTYFFDEIVDEHGAYLPPASSRRHQNPIFHAASLSLSIFSNLYIQLPTAGDSEARDADLDEWLSRLAASLPIHARFDDAHIFQTDEILVLVTRRGDGVAGRAEHLVETIVRRPIPVESVPAFLFGGTGTKLGSAGMLTPERYRQQAEARLSLPGVQPDWLDRAVDQNRFDPKLYLQWVRHAGRYPAWLSILRRRDVERRAEYYVEDKLAQDESSRPEVPHLDGYDDIPF